MNLYTVGKSARSSIDLARRQVSEMIEAESLEGNICIRPHNTCNHVHVCILVLYRYRVYVWWN